MGEVAEEGTTDRPSRIFQLRCFEFVVVVGGGGVHYLSEDERRGGRERDGDGENWDEVLRLHSDP